MSPKIFISYRHHDNPDFVHRMRDLLIPHYGTDNIFLDAYSIPAGMPFAKFIEIKIREYDAVIAVVGPQWLPLLREKASLFQDDYVRKELEWSLKYDKVIIPVCIKDATLPAKTDLPPELRPLLDLNAITISDGLHFTADVARIVEGITTLLRERPANSMPAYLLNGNAKAAFLEPFLADGWGTCMSLAEHPALLHGKSWAMKEVRLQHRPIKFTVPVDHKDAYQHYFDSSYDKKRFFDDGEKVMLEHVPHTSIDSPTLMLETLQTQYSVTKYYSEIIAPSLSDRDHIINTLIEQGKVNCAHSFCMHAIIVTSDDKVLITQRSWRVAYYPSAWQCTLS
ncbi:MAG: toll/interleukin-1 receptor domain-containing protein, partial [Anaerolineae bacterium]